SSYAFFDGCTLKIARNWTAFCRRSRNSMKLCATSMLIAWKNWLRTIVIALYPPGYPTSCEASDRNRTRTRPLGTGVVVEPATRSCGFKDKITTAKVPGVVAIVLRSRYHQLFASVTSAAYFPMSEVEAVKLAPVELST